MVDSFRALVVVLFFASLIWIISRPALQESLTSDKAFQPVAVCWLSITCIAFLVPNFWLSLFLMALPLLYFSRNEKNIPAFYFAVLFAVPLVTDEVPALGLFRYLFDLSYARLLSLVVLLPAAIKILKADQVKRRELLASDWFVIGYVILQFALFAQATTMTSALRMGAFYGCIDFALPYFVFSRMKWTRDSLRTLLVWLSISCSVLAAIAIFEHFWGWLLYSSVKQNFDSTFGFGNYLRRDGFLRAQASSGHPIVLGYIIVIGSVAGISVLRLAQRPIAWVVLLGLMAAGLYSTVSRGPIVGAFVALFLLTLLSDRPVRNLLVVSAIGGLIGLLVLLSPYAEKLINLIPFVGKTESENVEYRQRLFEVGWQVVSDAPFFGASDFFFAMEEMRQGEGIIDIVNSYLGIALRSGFVGLGLFVGAVLLPGLQLLAGLLRLPRSEGELKVLLSGVVAMIFSSAVIIATTSSVLAIPYVYWALSGLATGLGYQLLPARQRL